MTTGANTASLAAGTIPANGSCIVRFNVVASNPNVFVDGNVTNTIAAAVAGDEGVTNTVFAANVRLQTGARLEKTFAPTPIATGGTSTLTVTVRNFNATPLAGIAFSDAFPGTMRVAAPVTTGGTCMPPLAFTQRRSRGTLASQCPANASCRAGRHRKCGLHGDDQCHGHQPGCQPDHADQSDSRRQLRRGRLSCGIGQSRCQCGVDRRRQQVVRTHADPPRRREHAYDYADQFGCGAGGDYGFTDALTTLGANPQFTVAAAPPATTTCGGVLNAAPGASTITLGAGSSIPAAGSCTITVPVQASAIASTGARTNTIAQGALQTSQGRTQAAISGVLTVNPVLSVAKVFAPLTVAAGTDSRTTITLSAPPVPWR